MDALEYTQTHLPEFLADLEAFIRLEAPSHDLLGLRQVARWIAENFAPFGTLS